MKNLHLLFHKTYYEKIGTAEFNDSLQAINQELFQTKFDAESYLPAPVSGTTTFCMATAYPGMLIGTGYAHGTGLEDADDDINCGFSFDYVTGQPYIPGSSVKGVLSTCFQYPEIIEQLCTNAKGIVPELKKSIFGTAAREDCGVDVFFDAVIRCGDTNGRILGSDYITPHDKSLTRNPTPIMLLKLLPGVILEFRFLLRDSVIGEITVTAKAKEKLFFELLKLFGIGAKTNVGYGILNPISTEEVEVRVQNMPRTSAAVPAKPAAPVRPSAPTRPGTGTAAASANIEAGDIREGTVTNITAFGAFVRLSGTGKDGMIHISKLKPGQQIAHVEDVVQRGGRVRVKVLGFNDRGQIQLELIQVL